MRLGTLYYIIPDLFRHSFTLKGALRSMVRCECISYLRNRVFPRQKPIGGIKIHYQHCLVLRQIGYNAVPVQMGKYRGDFFGFDVAPKPYHEVRTRLNHNNVVVSTEFLPYEGLLFPYAVKVLFVQNWINVPKRLRPEDRHKSYLEIGYDYVITCSSYATRIVKEIMGIDAVTIRNGIDQGKFVAKRQAQIPNRILAMPRKNRADLDAIIQSCSDLECEFVLADGLNEQELITEYQKSDIFLATGYPEGFGLPPLEAMACGCAVVGFTGRGASEYMIDGETALTAPDGDVRAAAEHLKRLLRDRPLKEAIRRNGMAMAKNYTLEAMGNDLRAFYQQVEKELSARR